VVDKNFVNTVKEHSVAEQDFKRCNSILYVFC